MSFELSEFQGLEVGVGVGVGQGWGGDCAKGMLGLSSLGHMDFRACHLQDLTIP